MTSLGNTRILVVDDNLAIHDDIRKIIGSEASQRDRLLDAKSQLFGEAPPTPRKTFQIESAYQGEEALAKVQEALARGQPYAMAFIDIRMPPGWDGIETITEIWKIDPQLQAVICTAYSDYSWDEMVREVGNSDNLVILKKPFDNIEVLQLAHALTEKWELHRRVTQQLANLDQLVVERTAALQQANERLIREVAERIQAEKALIASNERFSKAFRSSPVALALQSFADGRFIDVNRVFLEITGLHRDEVVGRTSDATKWWIQTDTALSFRKKVLEGTPVKNFPARFRTKTGLVRDALLSAEVLHLDEQVCLLTAIQDITDRLEMEAQLRHTHKMEAVGELAAGIAHDFNNILTIIVGHTSLLSDGKEPGSKEWKTLEIVRESADRASRLVRQLLAFSREQEMELRVINLGPSLLAFAELLPPVLGEAIRLEVQVGNPLPEVEADSILLSQLLMSLAVNARDAMPHGGTLVLATDVVVVDSTVHPDGTVRKSGKYLRISLGDTGCGIARDILPRIFDPFFTTKPVGKGTGLGLSMAYGVARQHHGWIDVESEVGRGSKFQVFLPLVESLPCLPASSEIQAPPPPGAPART